MSSSPDAPFVRLEKVEKWFGRASALQDITLSVRRGDFMVLLGRNGAGKSTLLRVIARLTKPNSGKVEISGIDIRQRHGPKRTPLLTITQREKRSAGYLTGHACEVARVRKAVRQPGPYRKIRELGNGERVDTSCKGDLFEE